jgi:hypothetical protein
MGAFAFVVLLVILAIAAPLIVKLVGARPPTDQATKYLDSFGTPASPRRARSATAVSEA